MFKQATTSGWVFVECPLCGGSEQELVFSHRNRLFDTDTDATLRRCGSCGLHITNPQPRGETLDAFYQTQSYYTHQKSSGLKARLHRHRLKLQVGGPLARVRFFLEKHTNHTRLTTSWCPDSFSWVKGAGFLDYGCGTGTSTKMASDLGLRAVGVEPDPQARGVAASLGVRVFESLDELDGSAEGRAEETPVRFDRMLLSHVLEHVPNPLEVLETLRGRLRPGGRLLLSVPNVESLQAQVFGGYWLGYDMPRHLWHFSPSTLERLVCRAGFEIVESRTVELTAYATESQKSLRESGEREVLYDPGRIHKLESEGKGTEVVLVLE